MIPQSYVYPQMRSTDDLLHLGTALVQLRVALSVAGLFESELGESR
jgi:hypothetical protein